MYAAARRLTGAARRPALALSFAALFGSTNASPSTDGPAPPTVDPADSGQDFVAHVRSVRKEHEAKAAAHRASLEAAYEAELLSLLRSHVIPKIPEMKAKLLAGAADRRCGFATAKVDMPLDDLLLAPKHAELYEIVGSAVYVDTFVTDPKERQFRKVNRWLSHRPALEEFNAEVAKEFKGATEIKTEVYDYDRSIRVSVYIKFGQ